MFGDELLLHKYRKFFAVFKAWVCSCSGSVQISKTTPLIDHKKRFLIRREVVKFSKNTGFLSGT